MASHPKNVGILPWTFNSLPLLFFRNVAILTLQELTQQMHAMRTAALFNCVNWVESASWDGHCGLVVHTDSAVYVEGPAWPTRTAGRFHADRA